MQLNFYSMKFASQIFTVFILLIVITACGTPRFANRANRPSRFKPAIESYSKYSNSSILETQTGVASFYADDFHSKIAYSGEVYDMYGISAAHPSYPMGTIVKVTNLTNSKSVILRINDKMPLRPDRIIDLSLGTAEELEMVNAGITNVKVEVLEWGKGRK